MFALPERPPFAASHVAIITALGAQRGCAATYLGWLSRKGWLPGVKHTGCWHSTLAVIRRYQEDVAQGVYSPGRPR